MQLRKGELDHIVDDLSDGEGDEDAGALARIDMEIREDKERTKAVIAAVTEGHDAARKKAKKGKYSFDRLVGDKKREVIAAAGGEEAEEEELDEEEMLQRGLKDKYEREHSRGRGARYGSDDSDSEEERSDAEDDFNGLLGGACGVYARHAASLAYSS